MYLKPLPCVKTYGFQKCTLFGFSVLNPTAFKCALSLASLRKTIHSSKVYCFLASDRPNLHFKTANFVPYQKAISKCLLLWNNPNENEMAFAVAGLSAYLPGHTLCVSVYSPLWCSMRTLTSQRPLLGGGMKTVPSEICSGKKGLKKPGKAKKSFRKVRKAKICMYVLYVHQTCIAKLDPI